MSDALERLKNRSRPEVPSRDASLDSEPQDLMKPGSLDILTSGIQEVAVPKNRVKPIETKQTTIRLESKLSERLQKLCRNSSVSREVLIEAMFEYCESHKDVQDLVLESARAKNEHRQQIANLRRAKSMMEKFG